MGEAQRRPFGVRGNWRPISFVLLLSAQLRMLRKSLQVDAELRRVELGAAGNKQ